MADEGASTAAAEGGETGSESQEISNAIPTDWAENDTFKSYFGEDGKFDFERFTESHSTMVSKAENQPQVPETAEDYSFEFPKDYENDEADYQLQREMAKEAGMTQAQFEAMKAFDLARENKFLADMATEREESKKALVTKWGGSQNFEANMEAAANVALEIFGEKFAERNDLGNDTQLLEGLYQISQLISEDNLKKGSAVATPTRKKGMDGEAMFTYD